MSTIKVNAIKHIGGATDAINIASDSDVGIGTNAPVEKLHVHKESATGPFMFITNTSTGVSASDGIQLGYDGDNSTVFKNNEPTDIIFSTGGTERCRIDHSTGSFVVARENSSLEGGHITLNRASDNAGKWNIDAYGSGDNPDFRLHANGASHFAINTSGQWVTAPPGTVIQVVHGRYDPDADSYSVIASETKARSPAYVDITPLRTDSKLLIQAKIHTRMLNNPGCTYGIDYSTNSGSSWTALSGMAAGSRNALDFFYKGETLNHHYTGSCLTYIDSFSGSRRFSPWGQGWGAGTWELSYGHGEHSVTIFEIAT